MRHWSVILLAAVLATATPVCARGSGGDDGGGGGGGGDSAGVLHFDERDVFVLESVGQALIRVERSHGEHGAVGVTFRASAATATAGDDFTAVTGKLNWADGEEGGKTFSVPIVGDSGGEPSEDIALSLEDPTGGATIDPDRGTARLHISDDDAGAPPPGEDDHGSPGVLRFDEETSAGREGSSAVIRVERSHGSHGAVTVRFATADGSARAGSDYTAVGGTLGWAAGEEGAKSFSVPLLIDGQQEGGETVQLQLADPTGGATIDAERGAATLSIMDVDGTRTDCEDNGTDLCLQDGRFKVSARWETADAHSGSAHGERLNGASGTFWFFGADNSEVLLKVLDGCAVNDRFWVYFAATTDVAFHIEVTDTRTGLTREYTNPMGLAAKTVTDTQSFATCN